MRNEVAHIDDDREALHWAIGSVRAGLAARLNELPRQRIFSARSAGIVWMVIFIVSSAFNLSMALSARLGYEQITSLLGHGLKGFDYARRGSRLRALAVSESAAPPLRLPRILLCNGAQLRGLAHPTRHADLFASDLDAPSLAGRHVFCADRGDTDCASIRIAWLQRNSWP
jgi:hypothetical protein